MIEIYFNKNFKVDLDCMIRTKQDLLNKLS